MPLTIKDNTVRTTAEIYAQLQDLWQEGCGSAMLDYFNHVPINASSVARRMGLEKAATWILENQGDYKKGIDSGLWGLIDGWSEGKFNGLIACRRIGQVGAIALTNVPRSVIHHSPTSHEWGYCGSGPNDLALDILNRFMPPTKKDNVKCYRGYTSNSAWRLHNQMCRELIASIPKEGGTIDKNQVWSWISSQTLQSLSTAE